jgi:hypothetical protein
MEEIPMSKFYLGVTALVSLVVLATSSSVALAKGGLDNPATVLIDESGNTVKIDPSGSSIEPYRLNDNPGFNALRVSCSSGVNTCSSTRKIFNSFMLQYVQLSVSADPGSGCSGGASLIVFTGPSSTYVFDLLRIRLAENNNDTTTLVLPSPIRMQIDEELRVDASNHIGGGACQVNAVFGGVQD